MSILSNPVLLVILAVIAVVFVNLLLIASVQSHAKNTGGKTVRKLLSSIREPFQAGDSDLDKLADMVDLLKTESDTDLNSADLE